MAFPTNPTNGQATTVNNISYIWNSTLGVWESNQIATSANLTVSGNATVAGNVTAAAFVGSGAYLTAIPLTYSNSNVAAYLPTYTGNITAGNAAVTSKLSSGSLGVGTAAPTTAGQIIATNSITAFYSDRRLKTEISKIENALDKVDQLTGVLYTQNKLAEQYGYNNYEQQVGLYAQDVQLVQPEAVKPAPFDVTPTGTSISGQNYLTVQYDKLVPLLVEAIKELRAEVNALKGK
jgi:hypothetical protein